MKKNLASLLTAILAVFFCQHCAGYTLPELNRQVMAGVWRLTGKSTLPTTVRFPMKEFTVYPKKPTPPPEEYLLMLKEDGSFQQYDEEKKKAAALQGTWDFRDGKLILATDRPGDTSRAHDTMLVGRVVAKSQESLGEENAVEEQSREKPLAPRETHLSVPKCTVKVGKFMYPKTHPSFFEQPMFKPLSMGSFELRQVLGTLNAAVQKQETEFIELFRKKDFADKKFLMTNYPIPERKGKGDLRWSIKYNKYVRDPVEKKTSKEEDEQNRSVPIRVMEVHLFGNNTFTTTAGLGDSTVLRGKWWIVGDERDQLWMQVWRFGFGRSVSGSTFSEGRMLSHDDAKTYWGWISYVDEDDSEDLGEDRRKSQSSPDKDGETHRRLQVKGSAIVGWGLEPQPVARFIMREELDEDDAFDYKDEDDETDEVQLESSFNLEADDGIHWSDAFQ